MAEETNRTTRVLAFEAFCTTQDYLSNSGLVQDTEQQQIQHRGILKSFITRIESTSESSIFLNRSVRSARLHALPRGMCQSSLKRDILVVS